MGSDSVQWYLGMEKFVMLLKHSLDNLENSIWWLEKIFYMFQKN